MFHKILSQVENIFPVSVDKISEETWNENIDWFCEQLYLLGNDLFKIAESNLSKRSFLESKKELLAWQKNSLPICELRLRPKSSYYERFGQPISAPENPTGYSATGLEFSFTLVRRAMPCYRSLQCPYLSIKFEILGARERVAFLEFLKDHRRIIQKLISNANFEFFTASPFDNVEKYRGKDIFKKLELYAENTNDDENCFSISKNITENSSMNDVLSALFPLMILYDATLGYCLNKKADKDRIFEYNSLINRLK